MTTAGGRAVAMVFLAIAAVGCDQPEPPAVPVRAPALEAEDLAVIRALFDDYIRPVVSTSHRAQGIAPRLLVVGATMAMCSRDLAELGPSPGRCLNPFDVNRLAKVVSPAMFATVRQRFPSWNALPLAIAGELGEDVTLVSPTLLDMMAPSELLQRRSGSDIVWLTAPGYPARGTAVMMFESLGRPGAARIERGQDGRWGVAAHVSGGVDR
jgi:hypothetical protein